jgi:hypothetical protein
MAHIIIDVANHNPMQMMAKDLMKQFARSWTFILEDKVISHNYHGYVKFKPSTY